MGYAGLTLTFLLRQCIRITGTCSVSNAGVVFGVSCLHMLYLCSGPRRGPRTEAAYPWEGIISARRIQSGFWFPVFHTEPLLKATNRKEFIRRVCGLELPQSEAENAAPPSRCTPGLCSAERSSALAVHPTSGPGLRRKLLSLRGTPEVCVKENTAPPS